MKMLVWEPGGYMLYYKRLEQGSFELPKARGFLSHASIDYQRLILMISGIRLEKVIQKKRYKQG